MSETCLAVWQFLSAACSKSEVTGVITSSGMYADGEPELLFLTFAGFNTKHERLST
jgi:hypothetical protein